LHLGRPTGGQGALARARHNSCAEDIGRLVPLRKNLRFPKALVGRTRCPIAGASLCAKARWPALFQLFTDWPTWHHWLVGAVWIRLAGRFLVECHLEEGQVALGIRDFHDLVRILEEHPQWRAELRRLVLSEELLRLPEELASFRAESERRFARLEEALAALAERVDALTERVDQLAARVDELAQAQRRTEERLEALTARVDSLTERLEALTVRVDSLTERLEALTVRVDSLTERLEALTARVDALTQRVDKLAQVQERMLVDLGRLKGRDKEREFREKAPAYFGRHVAGLRVLSPGELSQLLEPALESGLLSFDEYEQVLASDLVATGRLRSTGEEVYLVAEVSWGVGLGDLERALRRAAHLSRLRKRVLAAVGGEEVLPGVEEEALAKGVIVVTDGQLSWPHLSGPS
jgi:predicted nuclease with TOPRIM domain